jgi:multisubunit Na+/H+ antiporter MnhG subunit
MTLDLRIPLGLLFIIVGAILFVFGFVTRGSDLYLRSAGMDINLIWGLVMLVFGVTMYLLGRRADKHPSAPAVEGTARPLGHGH